MDMNVIRQYLIADSEIQALVGNNIFLFERPEQIKCNDYIIYTFKELNGGQSIRQYQLDIRAVSTDKLKVLQIKDRIVNLLDCYKSPAKIKDAETVIRACELISGGGMARNDEGEFNAFIYFLIKI